MAHSEDDSSSDSESATPPGVENIYNSDESSDSDSDDTQETPNGDRKTSATPGDKRPREETNTVSSKKTKSSSSPLRPAATQGKSTKTGENSGSKKKKSDTDPTPKKSQSWSATDELLLANCVLKESKAGSWPPRRGARGDNPNYWAKVHLALSDKLSGDWTKDQMYEKFRRMKAKLDRLVEKESEDGIDESMKPETEKLLSVWKQVYTLEQQAASGSAAAATGEATEKGASRGKKSRGKDEEKHESQQKSVVEDRDEDIPVPKGEKSEKSEKSGKVANNGAIQNRGSVFSEWMLLSMERGIGASSMMLGGGLGVSGLFAGLWGNSSGGNAEGDEGDAAAVVKFRQQLLDQQSRELQVLGQRVKLMQELCEHHKDSIARQQGS